MTTPSITEQIDLIMSMKKDLEASPDLSDVLQHRIDIYEGILQNLVGVRNMEEVDKRLAKIEITNPPVFDGPKLKSFIEDEAGKWPVYKKGEFNIIPSIPGIGKSTFSADLLLKKKIENSVKLENIDSKSESYHFGHGDKPEWMKQGNKDERI